MQLETLQKDMIAAMKARDKARKDSISSLISAVKKVAIDEGCRDDIKEELVDRVILKDSQRADRYLPGRAYRPACRVSGTLRCH